MAICGKCLKEFEYNKNKGLDYCPFCKSNRVAFFLFSNLNSVKKWAKTNQKLKKELKSLRDFAKGKRKISGVYYEYEEYFEKEKNKLWVKW